MDTLRNACRIHLDPMIHRYLIANSDGRWDGAEKSLRHKEMCQFYVALQRGLADPEDVLVSDPEYVRVHQATQTLTDRLDEAIGFPLVGQPDYDCFIAPFFERFHELALLALSLPDFCASVVNP